MNVLRRLALFSLFGCFITLFLLLYLSTQRLWCIPLAVAQAIACYAGSEIVHTMYKKHNLPHPTSLAFQKELERLYKVK